MKYMVSFYKVEPATRASYTWPWWKMMPLVDVESYGKKTRYSVALTRAEGDYLLAVQGVDSPRWSILIRALANADIRSVESLQIEEITGTTGYIPTEYVSTNHVTCSEGPFNHE
jgi:hypothetical protein